MPCYEWRNSGRQALENGKLYLFISLAPPLSLLQGNSWKFQSHCRIGGIIHDHLRRERHATLQWISGDFILKMFETYLRTFNYSNATSVGSHAGLNIHFGSGKIWLALHKLAKRLILYRCNMSVWVTAVGMGTKHEMATAMPLYTACMRTKENSLTFTPSLLPPFSRLQPTWWGWRKNRRL